MTMYISKQRVLQFLSSNWYALIVFQDPEVSGRQEPINCRYTLLARYSTLNLMSTPLPQNLLMIFLRLLSILHTFDTTT